MRRTASALALLLGLLLAANVIAVTAATSTVVLAVDGMT